MSKEILYNDKLGQRDFGFYQNSEGTYSSLVDSPTIFPSPDTAAVYCRTSSVYRFHTGRSPFPSRCICLLVPIGRTLFRSLVDDMLPLHNVITS